MVSFWDAIANEVEALKAIGAFVTQVFPSWLMSVFVSVAIAIYYPAGIIIYTCQSIFAMIYNTFVPYINLVIVIGNFPVVILQQYIILPPIWTTLLYISITISVSVRMYHWFATIIKWTPLKIITGGD